MEAVIKRSMNTLGVGALLLALATPGVGADLANLGGPSDNTDEQDYTSIDGLIDALYSSVSFEPGESPDWERVRSFFLPEAVVVFAPRRGAEARVMDLDAFILDFQTFHAERDLARNGFRETLVGREVTLYGNIAHAFVVFEPRVGPNWDGPTTPGVDSIDLVQHDGRWWIASITTQFSSQELPIPERFRSGG